jgi:hypothetical protein
VSEISSTAFPKAHLIAWREKLITSVVVSEGIFVRSEYLQSQQFLGNRTTDS